MAEFLRKFKNRGIKITWINSILITKSINLQLFPLILYGAGFRCDVDIFKLTASAQSIYRGIIYTLTLLKCNEFILHFPPSASLPLLLHSNITQYYQNNRVICTLLN